jgi:hypothetical protein
MSSGPKAPATKPARDQASERCRPDPLTRRRHRVPLCIVEGNIAHRGTSGAMVHKAKSIPDDRGTIEARAMPERGADEAPARRTNSDSHRHAAGSASRGSHCFQGHHRAMLGLYGRAIGNCGFWCMRHCTAGAKNDWLPAVKCSITVIQSGFGGECSWFVSVRRRRLAPFLARRCPSRRDRKGCGRDTTVPVLAKGQTDTGRCWIKWSSPPLSPVSF